MDSDECVLIMSSIMHDIGKIEQRYKINANHYDLGAEFIRNNIYKIDPKIKERVINLILYHHKNADKVELNENDRYLLRLLQIADRKSAAHDRNDIDPNIEKEVKLEKISDLIDLEEEQHKISKTYYDLKTLENYEDSSKNFGYKDIYDVMKSDIDKIDFNFNDSNLYPAFNTLNTILYKNTIFVPSAFYYSDPNISLYHHLKLTAALAMSQYRYNKSIKSKESGEEDQFILLMCNLSGIQDYIFRYFKSDAADDKGTKRLKGRSFMIKLFTDSIQSYIIKELDLYRINVVWEKSDGFLLLLNNSPDMEKELERIRRDIDTGLIDKNRGITSSISWVTANLDDFNSIEEGIDFSDKENNSTDNFALKMQELYDKLDLRKRNKLSELLQDQDFDHEKKFGNSIKNMCESCGLDVVYSNDKCIGCLEEEYIGSNLYRNDSISIQLKKHDESNIYSNRDKRIIFHYGTLDLDYHFADKDEEKTRNEIIKINEFVSPSQNYRFIFQAKHVPLDKGSIISLNNLFPDNSQHKMLGVFKADVDNMGTIIAAGFRRMTISRLASLSFEFEYFFSIKLDEISGTSKKSKKHSSDNVDTHDIKKDGDKSRIYIVYSGGDDVSAIGEIKDITQFIKNLHEGFEQYFHNEYITISGGLSITQPKFPIRRGIINAEKNLDLAKLEPNKNSIHYIDTMEWKTFIELSEFGDKLSEKIEGEKLSKGFPYFLNNLGLHCNGKIIQGTVISTHINSKNSVLIPDPLVNYYIKRNYSVRKNNKQDEKERDNLILEILDGKNAKWKYMNFLSSYVVINLRNSE